MTAEKKWVMTSAAPAEKARTERRRNQIPLTRAQCESRREMSAPRRGNPARRGLLKPGLAFSRRKTDSHPRSDPLPAKHNATGDYRGHCCAPERAAVERSVARFAGGINGAVSPLMLGGKNSEVRRLACRNFSPKAQN